MTAAARPEANRRVLLVLVLVAAILFFGSVLFIISRAGT
jgi:hypothetical protein